MDAKQEAFLFVGGPADGDVIHTDGRLYWLVAERSVPVTSPNWDAPRGGVAENDVSFRTVTYRRTDIQLDPFGGVQVLYLPVGMTSADALRHALNHWRPGKRSQSCCGTVHADSGA